MLDRGVSSSSSSFYLLMNLVYFTKGPSLLCARYATCAYVHAYQHDYTIVYVLLYTHVHTLVGMIDSAASICYSCVVVQLYDAIATLIMV